METRSGKTCHAPSRSLFFTAVFSQSGAYGLTFMLPRLFDSFGADEKVVGTMLLLTTITTVITVYFLGHLSNLLGRLRTLGVACLAIAVSLFLFGSLNAVSVALIYASVLFGFGWALTYSLSPIVLTRLVKPAERVQFFALLSIFVMAGFGLAPVLAYILETWGFSVRIPFFVTSVLCLISSGLFFVLNTPIKIHAFNPAPEASSRMTVASISEVLKSRALLPVIMVFIGASVYAGLNNFQTIFADKRRLNYARFFLIYSITVVGFRLVLVKFRGGKSPYLVISTLQFLMCGSVVLFIFSGDNSMSYNLVAISFGLGYGVSYPILVAMAANDSEEHLEPQTLQLFALSYFVGVFGFPLVAGWFIVDVGTTPLLVLVAVLASVEASMALRRGFEVSRKQG
jgi:MFS family permease